MNSKKSKMKKVSIIIPFFNEEKTIKIVLNKVIDQRIAHFQKEIILVDDGSTDNSFKELQKYLTKISNTKNIKIITYKKNVGKGYAIRKGLKDVTGDIILIQDADLEYDPKYYPHLLLPFQNKNARIVYGDRISRINPIFFGKNKTPFVTHYLANNFLSFFTSVLFNSKVYDIETGYKVFLKKIILDLPLKSEGFEIEAEITALLLKHGEKIHQVTISTKPRSYLEGKKINWVDGFKAIYTLLCVKFTH